MCGLWCNINIYCWCYTHTHTQHRLIHTHTNRVWECKHFSLPNWVSIYFFTCSVSLFCFFSLLFHFSLSFTLALSLLSVSIEHKIIETKGNNCCNSRNKAKTHKEIDDGLRSIVDVRNRCSGSDQNGQNESSRIKSDRIGIRIEFVCIFRYKSMLLFSLCYRHIHTHTLSLYFSRSLFWLLSYFSSLFFATIFYLFLLCVRSLHVECYFFCYFFFVFRAPITSTPDFTPRYDFCLYFNWVLLLCVFFILLYYI